MTIDKTTALITGANKGLGFETARRLGELGWRVLLGARDEYRGQEAAQRLARTGADVTFVGLDVTSDDSVAEAVEQVRQLMGKLEVLINNARITGTPIPPDRTKAEHFAAIFAVNLFGPVRVTQAFLPLLRAGIDPRVVMVSSGMGSLAVTSDPERIESRSHGLTYSSSKTALNMVTMQFARTIPEIRFLLADPGLTATDLNGHRGHQTVAEGTDAIVELATASPGTTGVFRDRYGLVPW